MAEINKFSTSSLITRSTNDITELQILVSMGLQVLTKVQITDIWSICKIVGKSQQWTTDTDVLILLLINGKHKKKEIWVII